MLTRAVDVTAKIFYDTDSISYFESQGSFDCFDLSYTQQNKMTFRKAHLGKKL